MGVPKGGGYQQLSNYQPGQQQILDQIIQAIQGNQGPGGLGQQAADTTRQFLAGGQGFAPIQAEAQRQFQQTTVPSILNAFGANSKSSSALNQALAGAGANLNSALGSQLAQMQLQAAGQATNQAYQPAQAVLGAQPFSYTERARPQWLDLVQSLAPTVGSIAGKATGLF